MIWKQQICMSLREGWWGQLSHDPDPPAWSSQRLKGAPERTSWEAVSELKQELPGTVIHTWWEILSSFMWGCEGRVSLFWTLKRRDWGPWEEACQRPGGSWTPEPYRRKLSPTCGPHPWPCPPGRPQQHRHRLGHDRNAESGKPASSPSPGPLVRLLQPAPAAEGYLTPEGAPPNCRQERHFPKGDAPFLVDTIPVGRP